MTPLQDVTKTYLPIVFVVGLVVAAFGLGNTYRDIATQPQALTQRLDHLESQRKVDLENINATIGKLAGSVDDLRKTLLDPASRGVPVDIVRFSDLRVFCLELRVENPTVTIRCPRGAD